jgi:hypothetical protein
MRRKSRHGYSGTLAEPIPYDFFRGPTIFAGSGVQAVKLQTVVLEKLDVLCRHYGVDSEAVNRRHALTLARRYVPGFHVARGKPPFD